MVAFIIQEIDASERRTEFGGIDSETPRPFRSCLRRNFHSVRSSSCGKAAEVVFSIRSSAEIISGC